MSTKCFPAFHRQPLSARRILLFQRNPRCPDQVSQRFARRKIVPVKRMGFDPLIHLAPEFLQRQFVLRRIPVRFKNKRKVDGCAGQFFPVPFRPEQPSLHDREIMPSQQGPNIFLSCRLTCTRLKPGVDTFHHF